MLVCDITLFAGMFVFFQPTQSIHYEPLKREEISRNIIRRTVQTDIWCILNCERNMLCQKCGVLQETKECLFFGELNTSRTFLMNQTLILFEAIQSTPVMEIKLLVGLPITEETSGDGASVENAGISCTEIKKLYPGSLDGYYWLQLITPVQTYCDMTTDQGGWLLIGQVVVTNVDDAAVGIDKKSLSKDVKSLNEVKRNNFLLDGYGLRDLHNIISFKQIRIYCSKNRKLLHVTTTLNKHGAEFVDYVMMRSDRCPPSQDAFKSLPGDNSIIARSSHHLGFLSDGHIGYCSASNPVTITRNHRLYNRIFSLKNTANLMLLSSGMECDDLAHSYGYSRLGHWNFFVR